MSEYNLKKLTYKIQLPGGQTRLREMILFISQRAKNAPRWGKVKLNKILWRADFTAFALRGTPVTGRAYQRLPKGPAPIEMAPVFGEMLNANIIKLERFFFADDIVEERIIPCAEANLRFFSEDDLSYINKAIDYYWDDSAQDASDDSHGVAWASREDGDPMPYESAYFSSRHLPIDLEQKFKKMATDRGWTSQ